VAIRPFGRDLFLDTRYARTGTRFRVYPQPKFLPGFARPVTVHVDSTPGTIGIGPADARMYVVDARNKRPYSTTGRVPPYAGPRLRPAAPNGAGHFDEISPDDATFRSATVYGTIRCVLDIWEAYLGKRIAWHFGATYRRLEIIPRISDWNAFSMYGFVEFGEGDPSGLLCENFDSVAHEVGHLILKGVMGNPSLRTVELRAHEEACADLVAVVSSLHFREVADRLLEHTQGRLFASSVISRIGESVVDRNAYNNFTMRDVPWDPNPDTYKYALCLPFAGAVFDLLVELYERRLVARGVLGRRDADRSSHERGRAVRGLKQAFARAFARHRDAFQLALAEARDYLGVLLARTWQTIPVTGLSFSTAVAAMLTADERLGGRNGRLIRESFARRLILPMKLS
jgi:hypothetical protein